MTLDCKSKLKIAILASGNGTNAQNILEFCKEHPNDIEVAVLISDKENAYALKRASLFNVPAYSITFPPLSSLDRKKIHEQQILQKLQEYQVEWICLAGHMRLLGPTLLNAYYDQELQHSRIINIHPALLPAFPGLHSYQQAWDYGVKISGVTLHLVDSGMDTGPILIQKSFERSPQDTFEDFQSKGLKLEYQSYREFLSNLIHLSLHDLKKRYLIKGKTSCQ